MLRYETLVALSDVTKWYERRAVADKLSLFFQSGEVFGLVGSNGSGKTTTLRILARILKPDDGRGQVLGCDLVNRAGNI
jgi:ABC-2 type transport system ATP-binding protein